MNVADAAAVALTTVGVGFFIAGTVGLLRFPDVHTRLHALTKADNLGLGLVVLGLMFQVDGPWVALRLALVWLLAILAAATVAQLVARVAMRPGDLGRGGAERTDG